MTEFEPTANDQMVGVQGDYIVVLAPKQRMTKDEALTHAAWLVALADDTIGHAKFRKILEAVESI